MKISVHFKTPDALYNAVDNEEQLEELIKVASKWVKWNECITIEFDTEKGTAVVCEN